jgi:hypothetical protein
MQQRIFLHVGPPKTATTYLQHLLRHNAIALAEHGTTFLGDQAELRDAASELLGNTPYADVPPRIGAWAQLCADVLAQPGDVVISCERFSLLRVPEATTVRNALDGRQIFVVLTFRDSAAHLPSRWQERVKNGGTETWPEFCDLVAGDAGFRASMLRMRSPLAVWSAVLPAEQVCVITVPPPGFPRSLVAERFGDAIDVPPGALEHSDAIPHNAGLGPAEAELVRRLNADMAELIGPGPGRSGVRDFLVRDVLALHPPQPRLEPSRAAFDAARADSDAVVAAVRAHGHPVFGDLAELSHADPPAGPATGVRDGAVLAAALEALAAVAQRSYDERRRAAELARRPLPAHPPTLRQRVTARLRQLC